MLVMILMSGGGTQNTCITPVKADARVGGSVLFQISLISETTDIDFEYEIQGLNASRMDYTIKQFTVRAGKHWKTLMLLPFFFLYFLSSITC